MKKFVSFGDKMDSQPPTADSTYHPSLSVPPDTFAKTPKPGSKGTMTIKYEVENVGKKSVSIKILQGRSEGEISDEEFEDMDPDTQDKEIEKAMDGKLVEIK